MEIKRRRVGRPSISDETKKLVVRLYNENEMTCGEIAAACQISMSSLFRILMDRRYYSGILDGRGTSSVY